MILSEREKCEQRGSIDCTKYIGEGRIGSAVVGEGLGLSSLPAVWQPSACYFCYSSYMAAMRRTSRKTVRLLKSLNLRLETTEALTGAGMVLMRLWTGALVLSVGARIGADTSKAAKRPNSLIAGKVQDGLLKIDDG